MKYTIKQIPMFICRVTLLIVACALCSCRGGGGSSGSEGDILVDEGVIIPSDEALAPGFPSETPPSGSSSAGGDSSANPSGDTSASATITSLLPNNVREAEVKLVPTGASYPRFTQLRLIATGEDEWQVQGEVELEGGKSYELVGSVLLMSRMQSGENALGLCWERSEGLMDGQATLDIREMKIIFTAVNDLAGRREAYISLSDAYNGAVIRYMEKEQSGWSGAGGETTEACGSALDGAQMILRYEQATLSAGRTIKRVRLH